ncbi:hypothetical protein A3A76_05405 [Candidatus Woesebacteria bacterium RIFCSPLOWO2_01_FULL_39_23]|uniref:Uncharacterized protein n=2 Tax=Microgenomates group TaxID=1794810 RepID=A0A0H4TNX9_9BACT|nr:Uncharacterized protein [uncultured Microgenomates bacterium Rifle_16ft_4_minimus_37633]OGM27868.1 MAG: hypothetical protein A2628_05625 [Candidatus Woesebacteria bacterium RIFCSPHIGHO2_01_FULL_40_22]OGM36329.1 MAG: hypothetical protein A3E41_02825 [Candidatus Woesebacteria bacterium RIFCSPHIGHO2_12_FULL_38_9]OGM62290.1 MAG: hypothetical protein A3A76_05405 [Candidatus Woesebacteria bacterium RIFCSPLOWO2_01_FULL_39_23]
MFLITFFAQRIVNPQIIEPLRNYTGWEYVQRLYPILILLVFIVTAIVFIVIIAVGGIRWMASGGNKETIASAKDTVTNGVVGFSLLLSLFVVLQFIVYVFHISLPGLKSPTLTKIEIKPPGQFSNLETFEPTSLITRIIYFVILVATLVFFFMLISGGISWITSNGDKAMLESAKHRIRNALIGLFIVLSSFFIVQEINCIFKVDLGHLGVPPWCGGISAPPGVSCSDTDGGYNVNSLGTVSGAGADGVPFTNTDDCINFDVFEWTCPGVVGFGGEVCPTDPSWTPCASQVTCQAGYTCVNGACVPAAPTLIPTATPTLPPGLLLNSASGQTCVQRCQASGFTGCADAGLNGSDDTFRLYDAAGGGICTTFTLSPGWGCTQVMQNRNHDCEGIGADYIYCTCN